MQTLANTSDTLFYRFIQNKVVRFFLSAGVAAVVDILVYSLVINFGVKHAVVSINNYTISAHEFSLCISYTMGILTNFIITKYAVFNNSTLKSRQQFIRFISVAIIGFFANYGLLRFFVEYCGLLPTLARISSALSLGVASYFIHKGFTFKASK